MFVHREFSDLFKHENHCISTHFISYKTPHLFFLQVLSNAENGRYEQRKY